MNKDAKIYVAGHRGLVGSAIVSNLKAKGYTNVIGKTHTELDLLDQQAVAAFFEEETIGAALSETPLAEYAGRYQLSLPDNRLSAVNSCNHHRCNLG